MGSGGAGDGARQGPNGGDPGPSPFGPLELPRDETEVLPRFDEYGGYEQPHPPQQQQYSPNPQFVPPPAPSGPVPPRPPGPPPGQPAHGATQGQHQPPPPPAAGAADATQVFPAHLFRDAPQPGPAPAPQPPPGYSAQQAPPAHQPPPGAPPGYPAPQPYSPPYAPQAVPPRGPDPGGYREEGPAGRSRTPLIAAGVGGIVVVAAIALFAGGAFGEDDKKSDKAAPTTSAAPKPTTSVAPEKNDTTQPPAQADPTAGQAGAVDELLKVSAGSRQIVAQAVQQIQNCTDPAAGAAALNQAATQRDQQVAGLAGLKTDKLDRGADLVTGLREAWTASAESDRELAAWGTEMAQGGCTDGKAKYTDHKRGADRASGRATTAKNKVVGIWNPIALGNNLKKRGANEI